ncbi:PLP-dependent aminotransferase family protein [candidate division KSB1 bacterium]|nr:PLP-dependent aminotransferase family protein [candidate division KSB1 bacterium]
MVKFSANARAMRSSAIRELLNVAVRPDMISFAGGMPNPSLFPIEQVDELYRSLTLEQKQVGFQYGPTGGYPPLVESIKNYLKKKNLPLEGNDLMITTGSLQALNLLAKIFIDPGDGIVTEDPCFIGGVSAFVSFQARLAGVPLDADGMDLDAFDRAVESLPHPPKLVYITPNFQNPAGIIYSRERRLALLDRLRCIDTVLLEDDPYNELYFDASDKDLTTPLKVLAQEEIPICYTGSLSKIFGPGMRIGFLLAPKQIIGKCELAKQSMDACTSTFTQVLANAFFEQGMLKPYVETLRQAYKRRAEIMLGGLKEHMPKGVKWNTPKGGFYIWVELPQHIDASQVLKVSVAKGAVFVVGKAFDPQGTRNNFIRLSFSHTPESKISRGVEIVSQAVSEFL